MLSGMNSVATKNPGKVTKQRSLGGCGTCRRRHAKCDQVKPICLTCRAVGVPCEGYAAQDLRWVSSSPKGYSSKVEASVSFGARRPLYTGNFRGLCHAGYLC